MSPEREPMENDSNSRTAEELEQQTVDVYKSPQDAIQLIQSGLVMIIGLLIAVTGLIITLNGGSTLWGYGLMMIGAALACFFAFYADYLKRKNKIQTYKELSDFYDYSMKLLNQDNH